MSGKAYEAYLHSPGWRRRRLARLHKDGHCCTVCQGRVELEVHHLTYERLGEELLDDLVTLCSGCHGALHQLERGGDAGLDPASLFDQERAAYNRATNPVVARYRARLDEQARREVADGSRARARVRVQRQETPKERERAVALVAALGFDSGDLRAVQEAPDQK